MAIAHRVTRTASPGSPGNGLPAALVQADQAADRVRGYWLPTSFDSHGAIDEYWACREGAVVMDLSPLRKFEVVGPRRRGAAAGGRHPQTQETRHRPGRVHRGLQRDRRDARRRDDIPARPRHVPLRRRRRVRRDLAAASSPGGWAWTGSGSSTPPTTCTTSPCRARSRVTCCGSWCGRLRPSRNSAPWAGSGSRSGASGDPGPAADRLPDRLHRRARLRALVPPGDAPALWDLVWEAGRPYSGR